MLNKADKIKVINEAMEECMDGDYFNSGMGSTQAQTIIEWALENAPDEKIDEWYKPSIPMYVYSIGPAIKAIENAAPILIPIKAITFVLDSSLVRSAASAMIAAATAPAPCIARPINKP